jgi:hypothetical protein
LGVLLEVARRRTSLPLVSPRVFSARGERTFAHRFDRLTSEPWKTQIKKPSRASCSSGPEPRGTSTGSAKHRGHAGPV